MLWWTLRKLQSVQAWKREQVARQLGERRDTRAVEPLARALKDSDSNVRRAALEALTRIGSVAIEPLCRALRAKDNNVQRASALDLARTWRFPPSLLTLALRRA